MKYALIFILLISPFSINAQTLNKRHIKEVIVDFRSMSRAAMDGDIESVKIFLNRHVPPNGISLMDSAELEKYSDTDEIDDHFLYYTDTYVRPIQAAAENGHLEIVKLLLKSGANPNWCCCECVTALHMAIANKHEEVANLLIENGANINLPYQNAKGESFANCLVFAKHQGLKSTANLIKSKK